MQGEQLSDLLQSVDTSIVSGFDIFWIVILNILMIVVVKFVFDGIDYLETKDKPNLKLGAFINYSSIIGFVERILYIIGFWTVSFELITIVIAVKTIMRFTTVNAVEKERGSKGRNSKITAEKYILGTLLNLLIAVIFVCLFK